MSAAPPPARHLWRPTEDAAAVHALHLLAIATEAPTNVRADPAEHFGRIRGGAGQVIGGFQADGRLVAYGVLALELPVVFELAALLDEDAALLCVLDGSAVHPDHRGQRLHQSSIDERLRRGAGFGCRQAAATVAPRNIYSLSGLMRSGFVIRRFAILYGGQQRFVMQRDLSQESRPTSGWHRATEQSLPIADIPAHQRALAAGLVGHDYRQDRQGDWLIDYSRPQAAC